LRVLVDTSVWVDFTNGADTPEAESLARLIADEEEIVTCGLVVCELLQGLRRPKDVDRLRPLLLDLGWLTPAEPDTYLAAANLFRMLRQRGVTIRSTVDALIVRLAEENDCYLLARDRDMTQILSSGLVRVSALPGPRA
jgi:hypothetical protein